MDLHLLEERYQLLPQLPVPIAVHLLAAAVLIVALQAVALVHMAALRLAAAALTVAHQAAARALIVVQQLAAVALTLVLLVVAQALTAAPHPEVAALMVLLLLQSLPHLHMEAQVVEVVTLMAHLQQLQYPLPQSPQPQVLTLVHLVAAPTRTVAHQLEVAALIVLPPLHLLQLLHLEAQVLELAALMAHQYRPQLHLTEAPLFQAQARAPIAVHQAAAQVHTAVHHHQPS